MLGLCLLAMFSCGDHTPETMTPGTADDTIRVCEHNAVIENIMARRSIRKYKKEIPGRDTLELIMKCGINAPNGQNKQSWEVRVVDNPALMDEFKSTMVAAYPDMEPGRLSECFRGAPVMVFIARDKSYDFSAYDCGLLAENIMLSAASLNVGSVCLGSPVRFINGSPACASVLKRLDFSEGYELCLCVGLGYPDETPDAKPRDWGKVKFVE